MQEIHFLINELNLVKQDPDPTTQRIAEDAPDRFRKVLHAKPSP